MTYNIYGARATSPANAADLDAIAEVIRRQNPDFVTLNEVDVFTNRTGKDVHQARDLAEKLGMECTSRRLSTVTAASTATPCCRNTRSSKSAATACRAPPNSPAKTVRCA